MIPIAAAGPPHTPTYDHRLREHVVRAGARSLGHGLSLPRSTVSTWQRSTLPEGATKADILRSIESARPWFTLELILRVLHLEPAR